jgi:hypothetical protein
MRQGGIYRVTRDKIPLVVQALDRKRLSSEENLWLKSLGGGLDDASLKCLLEKTLKEGEPAVKGAYTDLLLTVNRKTMEEMAMREIVTWEDIFRSTGKLQEWEARAEAQIAAETEASIAAEREQLRRENERLRRENEQLRAALGA